METYQNTHNPVLPLRYHIPDSEPHVMPDGKLYAYGSFDNRSDVYCSEEYHPVSTPDMKTWTIHDESLNGKSVPWINDPNAPKYPGIDWTHPTPFILKMFQWNKENGVDMKAAFEEAAKQEPKETPSIIFAPDCLPKNGKYYLYFCGADDSEGVAVSDKPEGPFTDPVRLPIGGIDPAIFIDNDGQAYYYWGQLFSHCVKLNEDMISFDPAGIVDNLVTEEQHFFHEGSSMRKIGDTYYYIYADMERGKPTSLGYSTSKSPLGPFKYQGIIIDNDGCDPQSWNNHGSIECLNGQWYVFYHRCSRNTQQYRRLCVEKIEVLPDGRIPEVKMTSQGPGEPFAPGEKLMGYQACGLTGKCYIAPEEGMELDAPDYTENLVNITAGDTAVFRYVQNEKAWTKAVIEYRGSGKVNVLLDDQLVGSASVKVAEDTKAISESKILLTSAEAGVRELKLAFEEAEGLELIAVTLF